jgi:hypothetical protein
MQLGSSNPGYSYNVTDIDYSNSAIYLADPYVLDDESCPRVDHNVTVSPTLWLNLPEHTVRYLLFFTNCSIATLPGQPYINPISCLGWLLFFCDSFGDAPPNFVTGVPASYPSAGASERLTGDRSAMEHQRVPQRS